MTDDYDLFKEIVNATTIGPMVYTETLENGTQIYTQTISCDESKLANHPTYKPLHFDRPIPGITWGFKPQNDNQLNKWSTFSAYCSTGTKI